MDTIEGDINDIDGGGGGGDGGYVAEFARKIGTSEPAFRLLISIIFGYPLALIYRQFIYKKSALINHTFMIICGLWICIFNYGSDVTHSINATIVSYVLIRFINNGKALITLTFLFHMGYLLIGYYYTESDDYDIKWTMPHCVLVLRLIGLSFDVSDGKRDINQLSSSNRTTCLTEKPNLLEITAFTYFPASFLVGPQFPMRRYRSFINKEFDKYTDFLSAGLTRAALGLMYLIIYQIGNIYVYDDYLLTDEFVEHHSIIARLFILGLWGRICLYKYISCWLLSEGVATCFGLTFAGLDVETKAEDWSACGNIKLLRFENAEKFNHYIESFNVNTNHWIAEYIYKRLKFLGNRSLSHIGALLFLAIWHGFHSGYYMCFLMEFIVINYEREIGGALNASDEFTNLMQKPWMKPIKYVLLKFYAVIGMGWCLIPFIYLNFDRWFQLYKSVWFLGLILFAPWPIYGYLLRKLLPPSKARVTKMKISSVPAAPPPTPTHLKPE